MTNIPKARELIASARRKVWAEHQFSLRDRPIEPASLLAAILLLDEALPLMRRAIIKRPSRAKRGPLTDEQKAQIRERVRRNPHLSCDELAREYNVAGGRISEALRGL